MLRPHLPETIEPYHQGRWFLPELAPSSGLPRFHRAGPSTSLDEQYVLK